MLGKTFPNFITADISPIESFYVELNLRDNKWLINCSYNSHKSLIIVTRNGKMSGDTGRQHRNLFGILKFTERPKTPEINFKKHDKL